MIRSKSLDVGSTRARCRDNDDGHIYVLDHGRVIEHGSHDQLMDARVFTRNCSRCKRPAYTNLVSSNGHQEAADEPVLIRAPAETAAGWTGA